LLEAVQRHRVTIVASQRTIHSAVRHELCVRCGVATLERLSIHHIEAFRSLSGASVIGAPEALGHIDVESCIGHIERWARIDVPGLAECTSVIEGGMQRSRHRTLLVGCRSPAFRDATEEMVAAALRVACRFFSHGSDVVPGNGAFECFLARYVRCRWGLESSGAVKANTRAVVEAVESVLLDYALSLTGEMSLSSFSETMAALRRIHRSDASSLDDVALCRCTSDAARVPPSTCEEPGTPRREDSNGPRESEHDFPCTVAFPTVDGSVSLRASRGPGGAYTVVEPLLFVDSALVKVEAVKAAFAFVSSVMMVEQVVVERGDRSVRVA
jgi:hypothetical protein